MKIAIVNYEENLGIDGILSKYARKMEEGLKALGHEVAITKKPDPKVDVNHHINYYSYVHEPKTKNTLMVTHITDEEKLYNVTRGMETADLGICYSKETEKYLKGKGIKKLTTILPAHDEIPRRPIVISILTNVYANGCKREKMFVELLKKIDKTKFVFLVMGRDWENVLKPFYGTDFQAQLYPAFDPNAYKKILDLSDYSLYFGKDEGSMGILDATYQRIRTIAPNVGFHQELNITHPFDSQEDLERVFYEIQQSPADNWTWKKYCQFHEKAFNQILKGII